ncbi:TetR/AcrR family transcriptional regulator [Salidesulfovibrio brasiliensis]
MKTRVGRPRSEKSREAVLAATHALLGEGGRLTFEAIAKRAGVGKPTIYRWWPSLADIVLEALLSQADAEIKVSRSSSLRDTLQDFLRQSMQAITAGAGTHLRFLMAQAQQDEAFRVRFREKFTAERRKVLRSIFQDAVERGQLDKRQNLDILADMVFGAMWYRLMLGHLPMDELFAGELAETVAKLVQSHAAD